MKHRHLATPILGCALCLAGYFLLRPRASDPTAASTRPAAPAPSKIGEIYLAGDVQRPGVYTVGNPRGPKHLRDAVLDAGIANPKTAEGNVVVRRETRPDYGELIKVDLGPLLRANTGDMPVLPNDVIQVDVIPTAQ